MDPVVSIILNVAYAVTLAVFFHRVGQAWWKAFVPVLDQWTFLRRAGLPGFLALLPLPFLLWIGAQMLAATGVFGKLDLSNVPVVDNITLVLGGLGVLSSIIAAYVYGWGFGWPPAFIVVFIFCSPLWNLIAAPRLRRREEPIGSRSLR